MAEQWKQYFFLSASLGYPYAQARMAFWTQIHTNKGLDWAHAAANQGEREGYYAMSYCLLKAANNKMDKTAHGFMIAAARSGDAFAMRCAGDFYDEWNWRRWYWWGKAAAVREVGIEFLSQFEKYVRLFQNNAQKSSAAVIYTIGRVFLANDKEGVYFSRWRAEAGTSEHFALHYAIGFYKDRKSWYMTAVQSWLVVARRLGICKDLRKLIGKLIWQAKLDFCP